MIAVKITFQNRLNATWKRTLKDQVKGEDGVDKQILMT